MASAFRISILITLNLLLPIAIIIFATGFFPYKPLMPGLAAYQPTQYGQHIPRAPFEKLVFMVVDALRRQDIQTAYQDITDIPSSDFVFGHGSGFDFTQQ